MPSLTGLTIPLTVAFVTQFAVGFPLLLPYKFLHGPSIYIYRAVSHGTGKYIGGTVTAVAALIMCTSIYEAVSIQEGMKESDTGPSQAMEESLARAQMSIVMNAINVVLAVTFARLAEEVNVHDKLKKNHETLKKQSSGLAEEYNRATTLMEKSGDEGASTVELKQRLAGVLEKAQTLQEAIDKAEKENEELQKKVDDITRQYKSLENSYDDLMHENTSLKGGHDSGDKKTE